MENNEMKPCELALENLHEELRKGILDGSIETEFIPCNDDTYFAEVNVKFAGIKFKMTVAERFICYHNDFMRGLFDERQAFNAFKKLIRQHCKLLTKEDKEKINALQQQIEDIKRGQA